MNSQEQSENDIDSALSLFAGATPPQGMEQRLLQHMRTPPPDTRVPWYASAFAAMGGAACLVLALAMWVSREHHPASNIPVEHQPTTRGGQSSAFTEFQATNARPHTRLNTPSQPHLAWASTESTALRIERKGVADSDLEPKNATDAPSQPAPALPLTHQEKLLLAVAHHLEPSVQLASLRLPVWPLHDPSEDDDFQKFFEPPSTPVHNGDDND